MLRLPQMHTGLIILGNLLHLQRLLRGAFFKAIWTDLLLSEANAGQQQRKQTHLAKSIHWVSLDPDAFAQDYVCWLAVCYE